MTKSLNKIKSLFERFKDLTALGFANIASSAISGIFWFYIASLLGTEHYGEVSYFIAIAGITSTISFLGSGNTVIIYTAKKEKIQSTIFFITIISSVIASFVIFFIFYNIGVSLYVLGYAVFGLATSHILGQKLYKDYSKYLITQKILLIPFALAFYYLLGPQGVILGYAVSFFPYLFRVYKEFRESKVNLSLIKPIRGFMINSYVLDLSRTFSGQTDKLIIGPMLGFAMLGNYQLGIQFLSLLSLLPSIVYQYILPHDASGNPNKKLKKLILLVSVFLAIAGITLSPIVLPVLFPKFTHAIHVIQIVSLAIIPLSINLVYISKFLGTEKSKIVLVGSGIYLAVQVLGILTLGKPYGVNGVAAALVIAASSEAVYLTSIGRFFQKDHISSEQNQSSNEYSSNSQTGTSVGVVEHTYNSEARSSISFLEKGLDFFVRNTIVSLLIIGGIALFLRLYYFPWNIPIILDGIGYFWYAIDTSILGHFPAGIHLANNGWAYFLTLFFLVFHSNNFLDYMNLQRLISVSISVLTIIPVYLLCRRFFDKPYAIVGATIFAFEPRIIQNSLLGITDPLYILLVTIALVLFLGHEKMRYVSFGIIALSSLVRIEGLLLIIPLSIMFFAGYKKEWKLIIKYGMALCIFILFLLPMLILRIQSNGNDSLTTRTSEAVGIISQVQYNSSGLISGLIIASKVFMSLLGWSMIPIFIFFIPLGTFIIFKKRNFRNVTVIVFIVLMLLAAFYAYFSQASDTRYLYPIFPLLSVISLFAIKKFSDRFQNRNTILLLMIIGILLSSSVFLHFKNTDLDHEREALALSYIVVNKTNGVNQYYPEAGYLEIAQITKLESFPVMSTSIQPNPKLIPTDGFSSLDEYLTFGKKNGLTHLVLDGSKHQPSFLNDVFYNDKKYTYLTKIFDSSDHGFKYHLKIYKIDYDKWNLEFIRK